MAFITTAQLTTALAATLNIAEASLPTKYTASIIAASNTAAYQQICAALVKRGYSKAQVDTWIQGAEFNTDIGLYWCLVKGNGLDVVDANAQATFTRLDRRLELLDVELLDSNYEIISPEGASSTVGGGRCSTTSDMFVLDDEDDRIGEATEF